MGRSYRVDNGELVVTKANGTIVWSGRPDDCDVVDVIALPEGDAIVLLDYRCGLRAMKPFRNLMRVRGDGTVAWKADVLLWGDGYVSIELEKDGSLSATTWEGWRVQLDLATGRVLSRVYVSEF
jgi:hypothetical protein